MGDVENRRGDVFGFISEVDVVRKGRPVSCPFA